MVSPFHFPVKGRCRIRSEGRMMTLEHCGDKQNMNGEFFLSETQM